MTAVAQERGPAAGVAASAKARSRLYALLSETFSFPGNGLHRDLLDGRWHEALAAASSELPYPLKPVRTSFTVPQDYDVFQSEYIRLFEVGGRGGPPCPLHSGHYGQDRLRTLEELVRFYSFFGLRIAEGMLPDHVTAALEFMQYLADAETGDDRQSYLRAERDFLRRHLLNWWPQLLARIRKARPLPLYRSAAALALRFMQADLRYLERAIDETQGAT